MSKVFAMQVTKSDMSTTEVLFCYGNNEKRFVEVKNGEWIKFTLEGGFLSSHKCSNCGFHGNQLWHFCPNCGARMISSNNEIKKSNSEICPCIECSKLDNSEPCRKGCSDYQRWKEGEAE